MNSTFTIFRFDPAVDKHPHYQEYTIDVEPTDKILDCLNKIRSEQDPTLVYRASCSHGICGSDAMVINGHIGLACQKLVRDFKTANNFVIEPLPLFSVIKDLIVDLNPFFDKHRFVRPYLINDDPIPKTERLQSAGEQKTIEPALRCILCASCTSSCPISRANPDYLGPAALNRAWTLARDVRDVAGAERLRAVGGDAGCHACHTQMGCTERCPKKLSPTAGIAGLKRALARAVLDGSL